MAPIAGNALRTALHTFEELHSSLYTTHGARAEVLGLLSVAGAELWEEDGGWWRGGLARQTYASHLLQHQINLKLFACNMPLRVARQRQSRQDQIGLLQ